MKKLLEKIVNHTHLEQQEAYDCMLRIGNAELSDAQTTAIITGLQMRGLQLSELTGFRNALMELCLPVKLEAGETIDVCGTGGDGKNTFNISTATALVVASLGYKVVKHGNYGVSSFCGSSDVLQSLGYTFTNDVDTLQRQLDKTNICFLHAPLFHPALKHVAPIRKSLGVTTFFNGIGPLVNPANPTHQLTGTYSLELARQYQHVLRKERTNYAIIHGLDGFDELTFIGNTRVLGKNRDEVIGANPDSLSIALETIAGGTTADEARTILVSVLKGQGTPEQTCVVAGNAALALQTFHPEMNYASAFEKAREQVLSGKAFDTLTNSLN